MASLDIELVRHALRTARDQGYAEVELAAGDDTFRARLEPVRRTAAQRAAASLGVGSDEPALVAITAPLVGFLRDIPRPLEVGQSIAVGDTVAMIAALGIKNEVDATVAGEVVEILAQPGEPVEFGQVIARVRPE